MQLNWSPFYLVSCKKSNIASAQFYPLRANKGEVEQNSVCHFLCGISIFYFFQSRIVEDVSFQSQSIKGNIDSATMI